MAARAESATVARMSAELLAQTDAAIAALLAAQADDRVVEYQLHDGRRVRRAEFAPTLRELRALRAALRAEVARQRRAPAGLLRPGGAA